MPAQPIRQDESSPVETVRVVRIDSTQRPRPVPAPREYRRPAWTPRADGGMPIAAPAPPEPEQAVTPTAPQSPAPAAPASRRREAPILAVDRRQWFAVLLLACAGTLLLTVVYRLSTGTSDPAPTSSVPPPGLVALDRDAPALPSSSEAPAAEVAPGLGPVTTEIRVLQPSYTVVAGDTLASIARRHNTTIDALAAINNVENRNALSVGQRLVIP